MSDLKEMYCDGIDAIHFAHETFHCDLVCFVTNPDGVSVSVESRAKLILPVKGFFHMLACMRALSDRIHAVSAALPKGNTVSTSESAVPSAPSSVPPVPVPPARSSSTRKKRTAAAEDPASEPVKRRTRKTEEMKLAFEETKASLSENELFGAEEKPEQSARKRKKAVSAKEISSETTKKAVRRTSSLKKNREDVQDLIPELGTDPAAATPGKRTRKTKQDEGKKAREKKAGVKSREKNTETPAVTELSSDSQKDTEEEKVSKRKSQLRLNSTKTAS